MTEINYLLYPAPPFRLDLTVWVLRRRPANRIDSWDGKTWLRAMLVGGLPVLARVEQKTAPNHPELHVSIIADRMPDDVERATQKTLTRLLGLETDMSGFYAMAAADRDLSMLAEEFRGMRPPRFATLFESFANGIIGQQLSLYAAINILNRFCETFGRPLRTSGEIFHAFPEPADLAGHDLDEIRKPGLTANKARAISEAARAMAAGELTGDDMESLDSPAASRRLENLRGIGIWTSDYILLRGLGRLDVFPRSDAGALKGLNRWLRRLHHDRGASPPPGLTAPPASELSFSPEFIMEVISRWRPYAGLVYFHLLLKGLSEEGFIA